VVVLLGEGVALVGLVERGVRSLDHQPVSQRNWRLQKNKTERKGRRGQLLLSSSLAPSHGQHGDPHGGHITCKHNRTQTHGGQENMATWGPTWRQKEHGNMKTTMGTNMGTNMETDREYKHGDKDGELH
jgi:hypothetical protein